jgi:hypothetical protein
MSESGATGKADHLAAAGYWLKAYAWNGDRLTNPCCNKPISEMTPILVEENHSSSQPLLGTGSPVVQCVHGFLISIATSRVGIASEFSRLHASSWL